MHGLAIIVSNSEGLGMDERGFSGMYHPDNLLDDAVKAAAARFTGEYKDGTLHRVLLHASPEYLTEPAPSHWMHSEGCDCGSCYDITANVQAYIDAQNGEFQRMVDSIK